MKYEEERLGVARLGGGDACERGERKGGDDGESSVCDMTGDVQQWWQRA